MTPVRFSRSTVYTILALLVFNGVVLFALFSPLAADILRTPLRVGEVASYDIQAPYSLSFESQILTEAQRQAAAASVASVYTSPDTSIARQQMEHLRAALTYITSVRADQHASEEQKLNDLAALEDITLKQETAVEIISLSDLRWQAVNQEAIIVLEQVMRSTIREGRLEDARRTVPTLVSLSLSESQALIVTELVNAFIVPNSKYNEEMTAAARLAAHDAAQPVTRTFLSGEIILQRGQVISETDLEALQEYGLVQSTNRWQDAVSAVMLTLLTCAFFVIYLQRSAAAAALLRNPRGLFTLVALWLIFLLFARLAIPGHTIVPYIFPLMAFSLTASALYGAELAIVSMFPMALLATYALPFALELTAFYTLGSILGVLALRRAQRITAFFWAGAAIALAGAVVVVALRLPEPSADWVGLATLAGAAMVNGIASAGISLVLHFFLAQFLGMTTGLQLIELSRPDHPLLQFILRNAPGTYQHSLQLANLVEQAAEHIGADAPLARVGALYHDAGKATNPFYFVENQPVSNINPHNDLAPEYSAATIIRHVTDGVDLARKYRLPVRIQDFILEHHGTMVTRYQYAQAVEAAGGDDGKVDLEKFRYPGPRPRSRETALLMLADGCEARMRSEHPKDEAELRRLIQEVIKSRLELGQLTDTTLTLRDLENISDSFTATLRGVYHPRIPYPAKAQDTAQIAPQAADTSATSPPEIPPSTL